MTMTPELWKKVGEVLEALEPLDAARQAAELERLQDSDPKVAGEVARLLRQQESPGSFDLDTLLKDVWNKVAWSDGHSGAPQEKVPGQIGPYRVVGEVGQGGMGVVYRVRDQKFHRSLAVKVLTPLRQDTAEAKRRFLELKHRFLQEAQLMGQLQHPGIPPVHDRGELPDDDRPYFVMKLIKGKTLAALLKERSSADQDHPRLLAIFEQICQTLAYTHAQRIVHRDLKPANVMIGAFGEVQVMDWGLAKVLGSAAKDQAADVPGSVIWTVRSDTPASATQDGQAMGTPAYMAPEQARGEVTQLDERCDVFGLGAILCEILTGRPAFIAMSMREVIEMAQNGRIEPALARLEGAADQELVELATHCLAVRQQERLGHAGLVLEGMQRYLNGVQERLRQAELERNAAQVRAKEERRRRRLTLALAASVLVVFCLLGTGAWWTQRQLAEQARQELLRKEERKREQDRIEVAIPIALQQMRALQAKALWPQAHSTLEQALRLLGPSGNDPLRTQVQTALTNLKLLERLDRIRWEKLRIVEGKLNYQAAPPAYAAAFLEYGWDIKAGDENALAARLAVSPLRQEILSALDDWLIEEATDEQLRARLCRITAKVTGNAWRAELPTTMQDKKKLEELFARVPAAEMTSALLAGLCWTLEQQGGNGMAVLEAARLHHAKDFWVWFELGYAYLIRGKEFAAQAANAYYACLLIRPNSAVAWNNLGNALRSNGDREGAITAYKEAIRIDPHLTWPYLGIGKTLRTQGDLKGEIAAYQEAIRLDPKHALPHNYLGDALRAKGDLDGAIAAFKEAIRLDPKDANSRNSLGDALRIKGNALTANGDPEGAIAAYKEAFAYKEALRFDRKFVKDLGFALWNKGGDLLDNGDLDGAIAAFKEAIRIDPKDALAHAYLGDALRAKGDLDGAIAAYKGAIRLELTYAKAHNNLIAALIKAKRIQEFLAAVDAAKKSLDKNGWAVIRYNAACASAVAGCGHGDAAKLPAELQATLRKQALAWLRDELKDLAKTLENGDAPSRKIAVDRLRLRLKDEDFHGVRDAKALQALDPDERQQWQAYWQEVRALLERK